MPSTMTQRLDGIPRKPVAMKGEGLKASGEAARKSFADAELAGRIIARAFEHAGLSRKEAAAEMGYADMGASLSRWCAGIEPPQLARIVAHPEFRRGLALALAEFCEDMQVSTVITAPRKRATR